MEAPATPRLPPLTAFFNTGSLLWVADALRRMSAPVASRITANFLPSRHTFPLFLMERGTLERLMLLT